MSQPDLNPTGFDPSFATASGWAEMYRARGLQVVPCKDKHPALGEWKEFQNELIPQSLFDLWYAQGSGRFAALDDMGVITGPCSGAKIMLDLDTYKSAAALTWWQGVLAVHNNGSELETWEQLTGGGGRQMFFECPEGWMTGNATTDIDVDVRGRGGFAVLPPTMHASGRRYAWRPGHEPWEIPILTAPPWLLDEIEKLVAEHGGGTGAAGGERPDYSGPSRTSFGTIIDGRERYMRDLIFAALVGYRIDGPIPPGKAERYAVWEDYCRNVAVQAPVAGESLEAGLDREGRGAALFDQKWAYLLRQWEGKVAEAARVRKAKEPPRASEPPPAQPKAPPNLIPLLSAFPIDEASIPVRDWVIPGFLLKMAMTLLVAPPGHGKSLLTLQTGIAVALGMEWGGWMPRTPQKVLVINAEDDIDEMRRRLVASARQMGVSHTALAGKLLLAETPENIVIAKMDARSKSVVRTPLVENLVATIQHHGIGLIVADPFAETFEGDENSNSEVKWAGVLWREVARRTGAALLLVHHTKKYAAAMAGDADASRGGGSMIGIARVLCTLFNMTEAEAQVMGIEPDERTSYVRFDDGKTNYSKRGVVRWFEKKTVTLGNSTGFVAGDEVGVLHPWKPRGPTDGINIQILGMCWDRIDRGIEGNDGKPTGAYYSPVQQSKERWVGNVVVDELGRSEEQAKQIIKHWEKTGIIEIFEYTDPVQRKPRRGVRCVAKNRPDKGASWNS